MPGALLPLQGQQLLAGHLPQVDGGQTTLEVRLNVRPEFLGVGRPALPGLHWFLGIQSSIIQYRI